MQVSFKIFDNERGGFDYSGPAYESALEALDTALDRLESGEWTDKKYVAELALLVKEEPDFVDGHAHLAFALQEQGKPKKALEHALQALAIGDRVIPNGFAGRIEWGYLENRPFLRAMHGAALCYTSLRKRREAAAMMERLLACNPDDNQGIRYLVGSEYLRIGEMEKARPWLEAGAAHFPPCCYELALLHQLENRWIDAATALRRGFCMNPYIAEMLCGNPDPIPLAVWHRSNFAEPETARRYLSCYGDHWRRRPEAIVFLHWLYNHPRVLAERAVFMGYAEQLLWEQDFQKRGEILARMERAAEEIDDTISEDIVVKRVDGRGRPAFPWMQALR